MSENTHLLDQLRAAGLRATPQRMAVFETLVETPQHPTAHQLYEQVRLKQPSISQATVYNTLQALVTRGLIHNIGEAGDGANHYDGAADPHVNLICTRCSRIEDFHDETLQAVADQVSARAGYKLDGAHVVYYGLCPQCQAESAGAK